MNRYSAILFLTLCAAHITPALAAPAIPVPKAFEHLPEKDVAAICGYSLSDGAVLLYNSNRLTPAERRESVREFVAAAEYWHYREKQLGVTPEEQARWAEKVEAQKGLETAEYQYCGATAAIRTEALPFEERDKVSVATAKALLAMMNDYGVRGPSR